MCRDGKDVDRYWCPKPTSCFTFFYFRPNEAVNICPHLANPCTNFKCLSVIRIIDMLSIIVHYYFCVTAIHKPVITRSLAAPLIQNRKKNILIDSHCKTNVRKPGYLRQMPESLEPPSGCFCVVHIHNAKTKINECLSVSHFC